MFLILKNKKVFYKKNLYKYKKIIKLLIILFKNFYL